MTNAELIKVLRCGTSKQEEKPDCRWCYYFHSGECCWTIIMADAADALEAVEKRIAELMPKEGEWIPVDDGMVYVKCSVCGDVMCCRGHYCPNCGVKMKGEQEKTK